MSNENKKYIPEGVFLVCDKGRMVTQLIADPQRNVFVYGVKKCTNADNKFEQNILPFGSCKTCGTCKFATIQWTKTVEGYRVNGSYPLLEHSEGICKEGGGIIKIYFDAYEANLANENNNESAFVKENISSDILGTALTSPFGKVIDLFCEDNNKFNEGVGRGFKKGMESTWNFFTQDMWKADTWKGMGKLAVIGASYSSPLTGTLMGDTSLEMLDSLYGTDFKQTKDNLVEEVKNTAGNAWEDVKRGNMGEVGESYGQLQYAVAEALLGAKGAGLAIKGTTTGAKTLIGAERLAQIATNASKWMSKLKVGALGLVKTGSKLNIPQGLTKLQFDELSKFLKEKVGHLSDDIAIQGSRAKGTAKATSDIDIAIKVDETTFNKMIKEYFGTPNAGSSKERTMQHAIKTGKIQAGEAKISKTRREIADKLGMDTDISIIKRGGEFDNPPYIPIK